MSELRGVNFTQQRMTPADLGRIYETILSDGIVQGCVMSYSGATLSMGAGYIMAGGKLLCVPSAVSRTINQATSGYARLLLTIDLTKTATKTNFEQAELSVEYSATSGGFPSLTQSDVNGAGTVYQLAIAVVSLGAVGIIGIVEAIQPAVIPKEALTALGGASITKLWENASPTSSFAAQSLIISGLSAFQMFIVQFCVVASGNELAAFTCSDKINLVWPGASESPLVMYFADRRLDFDKSTNTIEVSAASFSLQSASAATTRNEFCIPLAIYGVKGVA